MGYLFRPEITTVAIEHQPDDGIVSATYFWQDLDPANSYTLSNPDIEISLSSKFPLKPLGASIKLANIEQGLNAADRLLGSSVSEGMRLAPDIGLLLVTHELNPHNKISLLRFQASSNETPLHIREINLVQAAAIIRKYGEKAVN